MMNRFLSIILLVACAEPPDPDVDVVARAGEEEQGRFLLGNFADGLATGGAHFSVRRTVTNRTGVSVEVVNNGLVVKNTSGVELPSSTLVGLQIGDPSHAEIRIDSITGGYTLSYRSSPSNVWGPYCDATIDPYAIPMQGGWTTGGVHLDDTAISFACRHSGVAAKCIDWDYGPGTLPTTTEWQHHQACTRMARADYCADGVPHTRELTPIWIRDFITGAMPSNDPPNTLAYVDTWPPPPDRFYFEAAWKPNAPVMCLSKLRWASFPVGGLCAAVPDPRTDPTAKYCEEYSVGDLQVLGAVLLDASQTMDMRLYRWTNTVTGDTVTTVRGFVSNIPGESIPPFPGYSSPIADGVMLRNLPGSVGVGEVTARYLQTFSGDRVTAGDPPLKNFVLGDFEGYTLNANGGDRVPWYLYKNATGYVTAITSPGPDYTRGQQLGYVTAP